MCRLFALRANRPVDLAFSFSNANRTFPQLSACNPDGFGVGWYENGDPRIYKRPYRADESERLQDLASSGISDTWIAHVRKATTGTVSNQNCHPFRCGLWLFAHNGAINGRDELFRSLQLSRQAAIQGQTDSEVYFHWVLQNIENEREIAAGVKAAVAALSGYSGLNFILTDGNSVYAFRDFAHGSDYYSLYFARRDPRVPGPARFLSEEVQLLIETKSLQNEAAVLVCSEKLTDEAWQSIPQGHLLTVTADLAATINRV